MITPDDLKKKISISDAVMVHDLEKLIDDAIVGCYSGGQPQLRVPAKYAKVLRVVLEKYKAHWDIDESMDASATPVWYFEPKQERRRGGF